MPPSAVTTGERVPSISSPIARVTAWTFAFAVIACGASGDDGGAPASGGSDAGGDGTGGSQGATSGGSGGSLAAGGAANSGGAGGGGAGGSAGAGGTAGSTATGGTSGADGAGGGNADAGVVDCRLDGDGKTTLVFVNRCARSLTFRGSDIADGALAPNAFACVDIGSATEELSAKRYWGFVGSDPGNGRYTLAEFTFNTDFNDFDWYNISHVDAFNLPMQIAPLARPDCKTLTCADDFVPGCPQVGNYENAEGELVACVSPDRNDGNSAVALYFEACDDAYAWSGDDQNGDDPSPVRACAGEDWDITFCPEGGP